MSSDDEERIGFGGASVDSCETSEEENDEPHMKKLKFESHFNMDNTNNSSMPGYSNPVASKLMSKMGFQEGKGLGKNEQGRTNIVEASTQRGRRGFGHQVSGFEQDVFATWEEEMVDVDETVKWLPQYNDSVPSLDAMNEWLKVGPKLTDVPLTSEFCENEWVEKVVACKSIFDGLENEEMRRARTKSNPFETIRGGIFQNRAAMKMANMDALLDFTFTNPRNEDGDLLLRNDDLLYFADVCAGPGGFSEYILWRRKCTARGFGFTLKGENDFKLHEFYTAPSEFFEAFYGPADDGDIYRPENLKSFRDFVMNCTDDQGVHFVMADGGFSVAGQENFQEIKSNRLYLCQFLCALSIIRPGGHFVCKLFDIFTNYSVGLIYLMYMAFKQVSIFKPVTSRPANSERYIICKFKHADREQIHDYMFNVNLKFEEISGILSQDDIAEVVPLDVMKSNKPFMDYIIDSNEKLAKVQCLNLEKIQTFAKNPNLHDLRQADIREKCLKAWDVPDEVRTAPPQESPDAQFSRLTKNQQCDVSSVVSVLTAEKMSETIHGRYDYKFVVLGSTERCLLLSQGRSLVYMLKNNKWQKPILNNFVINVELPRDTLLEVELVHEMKGEGKGQKKTAAIHVFDALFIYGENLLSRSYQSRILKAKLLCKCVNKITKPSLTILRVKELFDLGGLNSYYDRLTNKIVKGFGPFPRQCFRTEDLDKDIFIIPRGLLLIKIINDPWMIAYSRSSGKFYFYNTITKQSVFEYPTDAGLTHSEHLRKRLIWYQPNVDNAQSKQCVAEDALRQYVSKLP